MRKSVTRRVIVMLTVAILCIGTLVGSVIYMTRSPAKAAIVNDQLMFASDGSYSLGLVNQLHTLANNADKTTVGGVQRSDANQIRTGNGGALPTVIMFQAGGTGNAALIRGQQWRLVYISHGNDGTPVFTFMMVSSYTNREFNASNTIVYATSSLRTTMLADFNQATTGVLAAFPGAANRIVLPRNVPGNWHTGQLGTNNSLATAALDDRVWLPSEREIAASGIWNLSVAERSGAESWLRSGTQHGGGQHPDIVTSVGGFDFFNTGSANGVRPAIHLSFPQPNNPVANTNPLFNVSGNHNTALATQLQLLADRAGKTTIGITQRSDAAQIRTANGGALPQVNLFESGGFGDAATFRNQSWRLTYITHPSNGAPVFTFMMTGAYKNVSAFGATNAYETSTIRTGLTGDFTNVLGSFPSGLAANNIVAPAGLPGTWQSSQPNGGSAVNNSIVSTALNDLIWLPSSHEMGDGGDLWNLTQAERGYAQNGLSASAFMRSGTSGSSNVRFVATGGTFGSVVPSGAICAVRPAIHITLPPTGDIVLWNPQTLHEVKNGTPYTHTFAAATEVYGATNFTYSILSSTVPTGLTFNPSTRVLSGTPNMALGTYNFTIRATVSGIGVDRIITVTVARGDAPQPTAPTLTLGTTGDTLTVQTITNGEYRWRLVGETAWRGTNTTGSFPTVPININSGRTYEAERRTVQTAMYNASPWSPLGFLEHVTYTITYNNNGGSGSIGNQTKYYGTSNPVTLSNGQGMSHPTLGWRLAGWATSASGAVAYAATGVSYSTNANLNLFAVWERIPITWTQPNSTTYNVQNGTPIQSITLAAATGGNNTIAYSVTTLPTGLSFNAGTRTISGTPNTSSGTYTITATASSTISGVAVTANRTLVFNVSLANHSTPTAPTLSLDAAGTTLTVESLPNAQYRWRLTGETNWRSTSTNNTFTVPLATNNRTYEAQRQLLATPSVPPIGASQWSLSGTLVHASYTVTYNNNGGTGNIGNQTKFFGTNNSITLSGGGTFNRSGWNLAGWNTESNGSGTSYGLGTQYTGNAALSLFAVWTRVPAAWTLANASYDVTNGVAIDPITLPTASGGLGVGSFVYTVTGLPTGLSFNTTTRVISGTPNATPGTVNATATATSTYDGGFVDISRTLTFVVKIGSLAPPDAPTLGLNPAGDTVIIEAIAGCIYEWRLAGGSGWQSLGTANTFNVDVGISTDRTYEVRRRFVATETHGESPWSEIGSLVHTKYTVFYNSNGGENSISNQTKYHGTSNLVSLSNGATLLRTGWTLLGWSTTSMGSVTHAFGAQYQSNSDLTLYAVWQRTQIAWDWTGVVTTHNVTNGVSISPIVLPVASGGNGVTVNYAIDGLPAGLSFNPATRTISGTPNAIPNSYAVTVTASSTVDAQVVSTTRNMTFNVAIGSQAAPGAPTVTMNAEGDSLTIEAIAGGEYRWRISTGTWSAASTSNVFTNIPVGINSSRIYQVQRRYAATNTYNESPWSGNGSLTHQQYTIMYDRNLGTGGTIANQIKYHGTLNPITLSGVGNYVRTGYNLIGWNTAANGSGISYALGAQYTANATETMFAVWAQNTLAWNPQLSHSATNGASFTHTFAAATEQFGATNFTYSRVIPGAGDLPNGLTFNAGTRVLSGTPNALPGAYTFTLRATMYGVNLDREITVTVAAGTQTAPTAPLLSMNTQGDTVTIEAISGGVYRWRYVGQNEGDWKILNSTNTFTVEVPIGPGRAYEAQRQLPATNNYLASPWSVSGTLTHQTYTITYNSNGGGGSIPNQTKFYGTSNPATLNSSGFTRAGWNLARWNTNAAGTGTTYALGASYSANANLDLFAVWERVPISWALTDQTYGVDNHAPITNIVLPEATGGNGSYVYNVTGLPNGLTFNPGTRTISGTPNDTSGTYHATATVVSTYDGSSVSAERTLTFAVELGEQSAPSAPTLSLNAAGTVVTISSIDRGLYRWRYLGQGDGAWQELSSANTFNVATPIDVGRVYEAQRQLAATQTQAASEWSASGTYGHAAYTISYDRNGGTSGLISNQTTFYGSAHFITLSGGGNFELSGWRVIGWNTAANGSGAAYALNAVYIGDASLALFAVWERVPITWSLDGASHDVTNGITISNITLPTASGGNGNIQYSTSVLPNGLTFDSNNRRISGTPNAIPGTYNVTVTAKSTYDGGEVFAERTISFTVLHGTQTTPDAPTLSLNIQGSVVTILFLDRGVYRWRHLGDGEGEWRTLGVTNTFNVELPMVPGRTYEAQRQLAATDTHSASAWSPSGTLVHSTYTITYDNNGGTGFIPSAVKFHGTSHPVTLSGLGGFSRTGWTHVGWNTAANGSGIAYALGATYNVEAIVTMYAVWAPNSILWNPQLAHAMNYGTSYTHTFVVAEQFGVASFEYSFTGNLPAGLAFSIDMEGRLVLSGIPTAIGTFNNIATISASIDGNKTDRTISITVGLGSQEAPDAPTLVMNTAGNAITITPIDGGEYRWRLAGGSWSTASSSNTFEILSTTVGRTYEAQSRYAITSTHSVSAWSPAGTLDHATYTITYNNNYGSGTITNQIKFHGSVNPITLSNGSAFSRSGWTIIRWNTESNGSGTSFALGVQYTANANLSLFAVWERVPIAWTLPNNATFPVVNDVQITSIAIPNASGGNGNIVYSITGLPNGLIYDVENQRIVGTPNVAAGIYTVTATATSTYDSGSVSATRTLIFDVTFANQFPPVTPVLEINNNATGNIVTIAAVANGEYRWRFLGEGNGAWKELGTTNTFQVPTGISDDVTYEAQRRFAATETQEASGWSTSGTLAHTKYTIAYYSGIGGTGTIASQTKYHGTLNPIALSNGGNFTRSGGYKLSGWNTNALGTGTSYALGATYTSNAGLSLFAVWIQEPMVWNPTLTLPAGQGGSSYLCALSPLASGTGQTFTYFWVIGNLGGLVLNTNGTLSGTLHNVTDITTLQFTVVVMSSNDSYETAEFTLTVHPAGTITCPNPCLDTNCPIHGGTVPPPPPPLPSLPDAALKKDNDKIILVGVEDSETYVYVWTRRVGSRGSFDSVHIDDVVQTSVVFVQHAKQKVTYRCEIYLGDRYIKTVTYVLDPLEGGTNIFDSENTIYVLLGIGVAIFLITVIVLWSQRDRKPKKGAIFGNDRPQKRRRGLVGS